MVAPGNENVCISTASIAVVARVFQGCTTAVGLVNSGTVPVQIRPGSLRWLNGIQRSICRKPWLGRSRSLSRHSTPLQVSQTRRQSHLHSEKTACFISNETEVSGKCALHELGRCGMVGQNWGPVDEADPKLVSPGPRVCGVSCRRFRTRCKSLVFFFGTISFFG